MGLECFKHREYYYENIYIRDLEMSLIDLIYDNANLISPHHFGKIHVQNLECHLVLEKE